MKTPEEMAEEYAETVWDESDLAPEDKAVERHVAIGKHSTKIGFLAGYKAAKDSQEYLMNEMSILRSRLDTAEKLSQLVDENKEQ